MKFVYDGDYACFDGVEFLFRNPTTVDNKSTIEKLLKKPGFSEWQAPVCADSGVTLEVKPTTGCPKCGRHIPRGLPMHVKHCHTK